MRAPAFMDFCVFRRCEENITFYSARSGARRLLGLHDRTVAVDRFRLLPAGTTEQSKVPSAEQLAAHALRVDSQEAQRIFFQHLVHGAVKEITTTLEDPIR